MSRHLSDHVHPMLRRLTHPSATRPKNAAECNAGVMLKPIPRLNIPISPPKMGWLPR